MLIIDSSNEIYHKENHTAVIPPDDGSDITFRWHFPRNVLSPRMSGAELAVFIVEHMFAILDLGLLSSQNRVENEFRSILKRLVYPVPAGTDAKPIQKAYHVTYDENDRLVVRETSYILRKSVDEILSWIRVEFREDADDIIYMNINDKSIVKTRTPTFIMPGVN